MLCGRPPFIAKTHSDIFAKIKAGKFDFDPRLWSKTSMLPQDLIIKLLTDQKYRLSAKKALSHPWLFGSPSTPSRLLSPFIVRKLQQFYKLPP